MLFDTISNSTICSIIQLTAKKTAKLRITVPGWREFTDDWWIPITGRLMWKVVHVRMLSHYNDVIMAMASQITSLMIVYSTVDSGADQRKHKSSASLVFVRGIHRSPVNSPHKGPVTRKMFPFNDVIMSWAVHELCDILHRKRTGLTVQRQHNQSPIAIFIYQTDHSVSKERVWVWYTAMKID